jgi:hypothetical protein
LGRLDPLVFLHSDAFRASHLSKHKKPTISGSSLSFANSGLGLTPSAIGTALSIQGVWSVICQLVFLSKMQRKHGSVRAFQRLNSGWVLVFLTLPLVRIVTVMAEGEHAGEKGESRSWIMWAALLAWLALSTFIGESALPQALPIHQHFRSVKTEIADDKYFSRHE